MEYIVGIHPAEAEEGGYWAEVPALDGCFAQGESVEGVLADARGAIMSHLDALREDGQPIPTGRGVLLATVALPAA